MFFWKSKPFLEDIMTNTSTTDKNSFSKNSLITVILSYKNLVVTSTLVTTNTEKNTGTELSILTHLTRTFLNRSCPFSMGFFVCWCCCPSVGNHLHVYFSTRITRPILTWNKHKSSKVISLKIKWRCLLKWGKIN